MGPIINMEESRKNPKKFKALLESPWPTNVREVGLLLK